MPSTLVEEEIIDSETISRTRCLLEIGNTQKMPYYQFKEEVMDDQEAYVKKGCSENNPGTQETSEDDHIPVYEIYPEAKFECFIGVKTHEGKQGTKEKKDGQRWESFMTRVP